MRKFEKFVRLWSQSAAFANAQLNLGGFILKYPNTIIKNIFFVAIGIFKMGAYAKSDSEGLVSSSDALRQTQKCIVNLNSPDAHECELDNVSPDAHECELDNVTPDAPE